MTTQTIGSNEALQLIFSTLNAPDVERERSNPGRVAGLARTFGRWKRTPRITVTDTGVVTQGLDYLGAIAAAGRPTEVEVEHGTTPRRSKIASSLVVLLVRAGVEDAAPKLAIYRCVAEAFGYEQYKVTVGSVLKVIKSKAFDNAYEELSAVLESVGTLGARPTRVRSKIAFGAFLCAWNASPRKVRDLYASFLRGELDQSTALGKLLHAVRTDNINTGSGRRPFLVKAAVLIDAQLHNKTVDRASSNAVAASETLAKFQAAFEA